MVRRIITLPCLVMAAWTLTLSWLIADDRFTHFLAPKFQILVYAGATLSFLFTIGASLLPPQNSRNQMIRGLILILPILFILSAGDATLGSFAMEKRGISSGQSLASKSEPRMPQPPVQQETVASVPAEYGATSPPAAAQAPGTEGIPTIEISDLIQNWDRYDGKKVRIEGIFSRTVVGHDELSAVFRYLITCCVADALPVGVFLDRATVEGATGDDWVRASGKVSKVQLDGYSVIFMAQASVEKREKPSKNAAYFFN